MRNNIPIKSYDISYYLELWGAPVSEDSACGEDCSFSQEFEFLRAETGKDASLHDETTDWAVVSRLATEILASQGKDLWALVYAVYAEYRTRGFDACPPAFAALTHILRTWWDSLYPPASRMQRRLAPLGWLCGRMEHCAETTCFMDGSSESVRALRDELLKLQELLTEKAGDDAPHFPGVFSKLPSTTALSPEPAAAVPSPMSQPVQSQAASRRPAAMTIAASLAEMDKDGRIPAGVLPNTVRNVIDFTRQLAEHFLSLDPTDERAVVLAYAANWATLTQLPITDSEGKTQLTCGVPADRIQEYAVAVEGKRYAEILPYLARATTKSPYWFEGHALYRRCLEGVEAFQAASCLSGALATLLSRFPELLTYKYKDNTPFVPAKILPWLESLCAPVGPGRAMPAIGLADSGAKSPDEDARLKEALACSMEEDFQAGLRLLGTVPTGRSRAFVLHGILQARYCLHSGKKNAAVQLLAGLYQQMEEWNLLDWEPDLTARVLALLLAAQPKQRGGAVEGMIRRLHLLDLEAALSVVKDN